MVIRIYNKKIILCLFLIIFTLLSFSVVASLGVSPSSVRLRYIPGFEYEKEVCFSPQSIAHLQLEVTGRLKDYVEMSDDELFIEGGRGCITYEFTMPEKVDTPGDNQIMIFAKEVGDKGGVISTLVRVAHIIILKVPYPGKYIEIKSFSAENVDAGDTVPFALRMESKGNQTINSLSTRIFIYDKNDRLIGTLMPDPVMNIETGDVIEIDAEWDSGSYREGNYNAFAEINYDGTRDNTTTDFKLGGLDVNLVDYTKTLYIDGIKEFSLTVDSIWSEPIKNLRANVTIYNLSSETTLDSFETLTRTLPAWGTQKISGYVDTGSLGLGEFGLRMTIYFEELQKEYDGRLNITEAPVVEEEKEAFRLFTISNIIILLIILLLVMVGVLVYSLIPKKTRKKNK